MEAPPFTMDVDSPNSKGRNKRVADDDSSPATDAPTIHNLTTTAPRVLRRHTHRRRNVAATIWGPEIPSTPVPTSSGTRSIISSQPFNVYKALLRHPNLFFQFALRLPFPTIINLYAIDKEFHYRLNKYSVSLMHDYAKYHAPLAGFIFSWVLYPELCISDPMLRPMDERAWLARDVPGFRWIGMVLWRDRVVRSILTRLAMEGLRVPDDCVAALMKFWCLMEMKTTSLRLAFLRDTNIWTPLDIVHFQHFLVKLDMRFGDPVLGNGICELSHMLLTQKSLSVLWKVLTEKLKLDYDATTDILVHTYLTDDLDTDTHPWLDDEVENGVVEEEWGLLYREGWDMDGARMESPVDMVITEGIRRGLNVQQYLLDFISYGFVDEETGMNVPVPRMWRGERRVMVKKEGWLKKSARESLISGLDERFALRARQVKDDTTEVMDTST